MINGGQDGVDRFELRNKDLGTSKHSPYWMYLDALGDEAIGQLTVTTCVRDPRVTYAVALPVAPSRSQSI